MTDVDFEPIRFPSIRTADLNGRTLNLPEDFGGDLNLVIAAYFRPQQQDVNSWLSVLDDLEATRDGFRYFELPVVEDRGAAFRRSLDLTMRSGITDEETRGRTMTLYLDPVDFRSRLGIKTADEISLLLLDSDGVVRWQGEGPRTAEVEEGLHDVVLGMGR